MRSKPIRSTNRIMATVGAAFVALLIVVGSLASGDSTSQGEGEIDTDVEVDDVEIIPTFAEVLPWISFSGSDFFRVPGGDRATDCEWEDEDSSMTFVAGPSQEDVGDKSDSTYYTQVDACVEVTNEWTYIHWKLYVTNNDGKHLHHKNPSSCLSHDAAYCVSVINLGDGESTDSISFREWTPDDEDGATSGCHSVEYELAPSIAGTTLGSISWDREHCRRTFYQSAATGSEGRWMGINEKGGDHTFMALDFGVTQRLPTADNWDAVIEVNVLARFHAFINVKGTWNFGWEMTKKSDEVTFPDDGVLEIGGADYNYSEAIEIMDAGNDDSRNALARTLIGANLLIEAGADPSDEARTAIDDANKQLSDYEGRLPFDGTSPISPDEEVQIQDLRENLMEKFVVHNELE